MSNGTMGDPRRCIKTLDTLARVTTALGVGAVGYYTFKMHEERADSPIIAKTASSFRYFLPGLSLGVSAEILRRRGLLLWPNLLARRVWNDCDGGGWLKKHLDSARVKIQAGVEGVKGLVPQPAPVPVPVTNYAVSAEAIADRTTNAETIAKGVAYAAAITVVAAVSAALYLFGVRSVPVMEAAPAGFGATTRSSLFDSDQNQVL